MSRVVLLVVYAASAAAFRAGSAPALAPTSLRRQSAAVVASLPAESQLLADAAVMTPVLSAQLGVVGGLLGGGFALDIFFDVEEPSEEGAEDGAVDIYRDTLLRYLGYANEVGEAFRPLVPVEFVYISYVAAISYILADTFDKGKKGVDAGGVVSGTLGGLDCFKWQMLASVIFPSFCINRLVFLLESLQEANSLPDLLMASWVPTAAGLIAIPLIILPLDTLAHFVMNQSFRRVSKSVRGAIAKRSPAQDGAQRPEPSPLGRAPSLLF